MQNITKLSNLEKQVDLLARISADTVLFLSRLPDNGIRFTVLFNGLEQEIGLNASKLENELNDENFYERIMTENSLSVFKSVCVKMI